MAIAHAARRARRLSSARALLTRAPGLLKPLECQGNVGVRASSKAIGGQTMTLRFRKQHAQNRIEGAGFVRLRRGRLRRLDETQVVDERCITHRAVGRQDSSYSLGRPGKWPVHDRMGVAWQASVAHPRLFPSRHCHRCNCYLSLAVPWRCRQRDDRAGRPTQSNIA
jgi:hypothetical protein